MGVILDALSQKPRPVQGNLEPEEQPLRRRERRQLKIGDDETLIIELDEKFESTKQMIKVRKDIERMRLQTAKAYGQFLATTSNGSPNFKALKKFRQLVAKVARTEIEYQGLEVQARKDHESKRTEVSRLIGEHEETAIRGQRVPLGRILDAADKRRLSLNTQTEVRKLAIRRERRQRRQMWRQLRTNAITSDLRDTLEDALAEGQIKSDEFRELVAALQSDPIEASKDALAAGIISHDDLVSIKEALTRL